MKALASVTSAIAIAAAIAGCTVHQTEQPPLAGPSDFALSVTVTTSPQTISQNGADSSVVTAKVFFTDPRTGQTAPKANVPIRFDMQVGGVPMDYGTLSARSVVTTSDGTARTTYTAPPMPVGGNTGPGCNSLPGQCVVIVATTSDSTAATSSGAVGSGSATIALTPPGVVLPPAGSPTATFTVTPTPVVVGGAATFDASASTPGNGASSITSYSWTFGDGGTGAGKVVSHTFTTAATYKVTLTVMNDRGLPSTFPLDVSVGGVDLPQPDFVFSPTAPTTGQTVFFNADTSKTVPGHQITTFNWNFGDGATASGLTVSHSYVAAGSYNVVLSVLDDLGQKATKATGVTVSAPTGGGGGGGGTLAAAFTYSPATPGLNQDVFFNATSSTASTGHSIVSYAWDFGDGSNGSGVTTTHQYTRAGTYTVTLVIKDDQAQTATAKTSVAIANASAQIVASFTFSPTDAKISAGTNTVQFDATASTPSPGATISSYVWQWGDNTADCNNGAGNCGGGTGLRPSHTFTRQGTWVVRLTITDSTGQTATITVSVGVAP